MCIGYKSAGQVLRMTDVLSQGALCCKRGQALSCGLWLTAHSTVTKPLASLRWGSECAFSSNLPKHLLLGAMLYFSFGIRFLLVPLMNALQNVALFL